MASDNSLFSSDSDRQLTDRILDALIPPNSGSGIPGAGELGIADYLFDMAHRDRAVRHAITQFINAARELLISNDTPVDAMDSAAWTEFVSGLEQLHPVDFEVLLRHTYMGYYSRPDTRTLFGLSSQPTQPNGYEVPVEPPGEMAALTKSVRGRGPCFRSC